MKKLYIFLFAGTLLISAACNNAKTDKAKKSSTNTVGDETVDSKFSDNGLTIVESSNSVDETYQNLVDAIQSNAALSIIAELDHQANAASVDLELRSTRVLMFGNPNLGTPLMQSSQTAGIDLPQKFLVYEDAEGQVHIAYNKPSYVANRHQIEGKQQILNKIAGALQKIANSAAK